MESSVSATLSLSSSGSPASHKPSVSKSAPSFDWLNKPDEQSSQVSRSVSEHNVLSNGLESSVSTTLSLSSSGSQSSSIVSPSESGPSSKGSSSISSEHPSLSSSGSPASHKPSSSKSAPSNSGA